MCARARRYTSGSDCALASLRFHRSNCRTTICKTPFPIASDKSRTWDKRTCPTTSSTDPLDHYSITACYECSTYRTTSSTALFLIWSYQNLDCGRLIQRTTKVSLSCLLSQKEHIAACCRSTEEWDDVRMSQTHQQLELLFEACCDIFLVPIFLCD